jgi:hypothetical protein
MGVYSMGLSIPGILHSPNKKKVIFVSVPQGCQGKCYAKNSMVFQRTIKRYFSDGMTTM